MATPSTSDAILDAALATPDSTVVRGRNASGCWPLPPELTLKVLSMMDTSTNSAYSASDRRRSKSRTPSRRRRSRSRTPSRRR